MSKAPRSLVASLLTPQFITAVVLLLAGVALASPLAKYLPFGEGLAEKRIKDPIDLRAPLSALSVEALAPYRVLDRAVFDATTIDALGTDEYLSWTLEDTSLEDDDPLKYANLLVTYYTGGHSLVPHTPDVCYFGSGYKPAQSHENQTVEVATLGPEEAQVPIRVCTFVKTAVFNERKITVLYMFHCNGAFMATRNKVRLKVSNPSITYAYFSKFELSFPGATREQSVAGSVKLLKRVLPLLVEQHWPDVEAAERAAREKAAAAG